VLRIKQHEVSGQDQEGGGREGYNSEGKTEFTERKQTKKHLNNTEREVVEGWVRGQTNGRLRTGQPKERAIT